MKIRQSVFDRSIDCKQWKRRWRESDLARRKQKRSGICHETPPQRRATDKSVSLRFFVQLSNKWHAGQTFCSLRGSSRASISAKRQSVRHNCAKNVYPFENTISRAVSAFLSTFAIVRCVRCDVRCVPRTRFARLLTLFYIPLTTNVEYFSSVFKLTIQEVTKSSTLFSDSILG